MTTTHQTTECPIPDCYRHRASRQDAPLVQLPLQHEPLRSPSEAHDDELYDAYRRGYADGWADAHTERLRAENEDLREVMNQQ
jgi:hypothetical protein